MKPVLASILVIVLVGAVGGQSQKRRVYAGTTPIPALVLPGDSEIIVESRTSPPLTVAPPPGVSYIEWLVNESDLVVVARVGGRQAALVQGDMWVQTIVTATIEEVFKDAGSSANKGDRVVFLEDGGDIGIGPTRVHASVPWKHSTVLGDRYLVFTERGPKGELYVLPESTYHLAGAAPAKLDRLQTIRSRS